MSFDGDKIYSETGVAEDDVCVYDFTYEADSITLLTLVGLEGHLPHVEIQVYT